MSVPLIPPTSAGKADTPRLRLDYLDGLRALAALYVVLHHAMLEVWSQSSGFHGRTLLIAGPFRYGHFAVALFITLSGFCLMLPVLRGNGTLHSVKIFFARRARRILPPFYCAFALSLALIGLLIGHKTGTHWDICLPVTPLSLFANLLMLQDILPFGRQGSINHVFWSIAVEWKIYFLFPLLLLAWRRFGSAATTLITAVTVCILFAILRGTFWEGLCIQYLFLFTLGILAATIVYSPSEGRPARWHRFPWGATAAAGGMLLLLLNYHWRIFHQGWPVFIEDILMGAVAFALLLAASGSRGWLRRALEWRPLVLVGTFSYSLYLIHAPLLQVIWQYGLHPLRLSDSATFLILALVGTPLIVAASYLFFLGCERPFLVTRRNETLAETSRDAALSPAP